MTFENCAISTASETSSVDFVNQDFLQTKFDRKFVTQNREKYDFWDEASSILELICFDVGIKMPQNIRPLGLLTTKPQSVLNFKSKVGSL